MMNWADTAARLRRNGVLGINWRNAEYTLPYNRRDRYPLVDDKVLTKELAMGAGVAVPELYGVIEIQRQVRDLSAILEKHRDFVVKPARGSQGDGIIVVTGRSRALYRSADGSLLDDEEMSFHVSNIISGIYSLGGQTDKALIEYRMRRYGGERPSFETIVATGPRAALPHARATSRRLRPKEFILMDLGVILSGYASDMTRTVFLGKAPAKAARVYRAVKEAVEEAEQQVASGRTAGSVDQAARRVLRRYGYERYFTHSLGHGLGREVHELPRVGRGQATPLPEGATITIEPGVYLEGYGGVRIEDVVVVRKGGAELLTPTSKELMEL